MKKTEIIKMQSIHQIITNTLISIALLYPLSVYSHAGGVDSNGGHFNKKTEEYHCHNNECVPPISSQSNPDSKIKIATFNIRVFGKSKIKKPKVMARLAEIVKQFDLVAIQEIKDKSGKTAPAFLEAINQDGSEYRYLISERSGQQVDDKHSQEQYAYFYNTKTVTPTTLDTLYDDSEHDYFQREPYVASFKAVDGTFDFVMITIHTKPKAAVEEIEALDEVLEWVRSRSDGEDDYIVLGDYNASCSYANEDEISNFTIHSENYYWIVPNDADTNQSSKSECAYDRIVITNDTKSDYANNWGIVEIQNPKVSDHHAVWAEFYTTRD